MLANLPSLWLMCRGLGRGSMIIRGMSIALSIWSDAVIQVVLLFSLMIG